MSRFVLRMATFVATIWLASCAGPVDRATDTADLEIRARNASADSTPHQPETATMDATGDGLDLIELETTTSLPNDVHDATEIDVGEMMCPNGHVRSQGGGCMPVGIQGCADLFIEDDGLCRPRMEKCTPGTIPKFDEGCVPVGIQDCAGLFMEDDGLCHPRMDKCPPGTIPKFDEGCVPVGIQDCAEVFIEEDGLCHPSMGKCPAETFAVPSQGCLPIDGAGGCGDGTWGNITDEPNTIYVDLSNLDIGAKGTKSDPFGTIAEALQAAPAGGRIVLAAGTYDEPLKITKPVTLVGRCTSMVRLEGSQFSDTGLPAAVWVISADVDIRNVRIGGTGVGVLVDDVPDVSLESVWIRSASVYGASVVGPAASLNLSGCLIEDTQPEPSSGSLGRGISIESGATVSMEQCAVVGNREAAIDVSGVGTQLEALDNLIEGTLPQESDQMFGQGVAVYYGATATLYSNAIVSNLDVGVGAQTEGTNVSAERNLIEDTRSQKSDLTHGGGVSVTGGADATLTGNAIIGNQTWGIWLDHMATGTLAGNLVNETLPRESDEDLGIGILVNYGAEAMLHDNTVKSSSVAGIHADAWSGATKLEATGNLVEGTTQGFVQGQFGGGYGIQVTMGAEVILDGNAFQDNYAMGIVFEGAQTVGTANWNLVEGTIPGWDENAPGVGIAVLNAAKANLGHNSIIDNHDSGILVQESHSDNVIYGNLVQGTQPSTVEDLAQGFYFYDASSAVVDNSLLANMDHGVVAHFSGDLELEGNLIQATVADGLFGWGPGVFVAASSLAMLGNAVVDNVGAGVAASGVQGFETNLQLVESLVAGTTQEPDSSEYGVGILVQYGGTATVRSSQVTGNTVAALMAWEAEASIEDSLLSGTIAGQFKKATEQMVKGVGDGVLSLQGSVAMISNCRVEDNYRAGILSDSSSGNLSGTVATLNQFGVVLQGTPKPDVLDGNSIHGNSHEDMVDDGELETPDQPMQLPEIPEN